MNLILNSTNRLITSGCSYTEYAWPTWATYLGRHAHSNINVGRSGSDNAGIARRVMDIVQPNDVVVILWSGFDRWNSYSDAPIFNPIDKDKNHWARHGCMNIRHKRFYVDHYHKVERFYTTMDYIKLIDCHSQANSYTAYHFSAFPLFLGESEFEIDQRLVEIYNKFSIANNFLLDDNLEDHKLRLKNDPENWHPTPETHWSFFKNYMAPRLHIEVNDNFYLKDENDQAKQIALDLH